MFFILFQGPDLLVDFNGTRPSLPHKGDCLLCQEGPFLDEIGSQHGPCPAEATKAVDENRRATSFLHDAVELLELGDGGAGKVLDIDGVDLEAHGFQLRDVVPLFERDEDPEAFVVELSQREDAWVGTACEFAVFEPE